MKRVIIIILFIIMIINFQSVRGDDTKTYTLKYYLDYPTTIHIKIYDNTLNKIVYDADVEIDKNTGFASISFEGASNQGNFDIDITFKLFGEDYSEHYEIETTNSEIIIQSQSFINILNIENIDNTVWDLNDDIVYVYVMGSYYDFLTYLSNLGVSNRIPQSFETSSENVFFYFTWDTTTIETTVYNGDYSTDEVFVWKRVSYYPASIQDIGWAIGVGFAKLKGSTLFVYIPAKFSSFKNLQFQLVQKYNRWMSAVLEIQNFTIENIPYTIQYNDFLFKIGINSKIFYLDMLRFPQNGYLWIFNNLGDEVYSGKTYSDYITLTINNRILTLNVRKAYSYTFITIDAKDVKFGNLNKILFYLSEYSILIIILLIVIVLLITEDASQTLLFSFIIITMFSVINHNYLIASLMLIFSVGLVIASDRYKIAFNGGEG